MPHRGTCDGVTHKKILCPVDFDDNSIMGLDYARDLMVVATHGGTGVARLFLGGVAERAWPPAGSGGSRMRLMACGGVGEASDD